MALVLNRRPGEDVHFTFDDNMTAAELEQLVREGITVRVVESNHGQVKLGFVAPRSVSILRTELLERMALSEA